MRYEAKHNEIKVRAQVVHNFKNPPKTLIRIAQCSESSRWGRRNATIFRVETFSGETVNVQIAKAVYRIYLHTLGYINDDSVFNTNAVKVNDVVSLNLIY